MRPSSTFLAAASILSLAAAAPAEIPKTCAWDQIYRTCNDGTGGCCKKNPCIEAEGVITYDCPDDWEPEPPTKTVTPVEAPTSVSSPETSPSSTGSHVSPDTDWMNHPDLCKEDDSNCNWAPTYFIVKTDDATYTTPSSGTKFHMQQDGGPQNGRRDSIALFTGIPDTVKKCRIGWYKPKQRVLDGTYGDGAIGMSTLDLKNKTFEEAMGGEVNYQNTKDFIAGGTFRGDLQLGVWGKMLEPQFKLDDAVDCPGRELVVHFALKTQSPDGSVTMDQVSKRVNDDYVQRQGFLLKYELDPEV